MQRRYFNVHVVSDFSLVGIIFSLLCGVAVYLCQALVSCEICILHQITHDESCVFVYREMLITFACGQSVNYSCKVVSEVTNW